MAGAKPTIAVLAVQGAFAEHERRLRTLGCEVVELRQAADLRRPFQGLVLPGGESTVQAKLLRDLGMFDELRQRIAEGLPTLGTCAGLILLAESVQGAGDLAGLDEETARARVAVEGFGTLPVTVRRNAYGRQLGSFHAMGALAGSTPASSPADAGDPLPADPPAAGATTADPVPLTFIRAPRIEAVGAGAIPLVTYEGHPVAVRSGNQIGAAFHPELDDDDRLFHLFLDLVKAAAPTA
ncbi:pyridoxal 5'-phosphate synthase glutaminase subunit PdxT [uncultured Adlercreutzia sp.]|uniref:pyridoxal 5'-phosphate synthase glutaminase subunit PdxT n=1 Tax=uncultured Adlercreutzia sp. TaxID=875803 RepID=UPI002674E065|nr:pyridoxal 5'-phosphate synthase glutaminase subunit PdxT [uncultured Adlercreutzia sp.]